MNTTYWMERQWNLKVKVIPILILTKIFPSVHETWYLKVLILTLQNDFLFTVMPTSHGTVVHFTTDTRLKSILDCGVYAQILLICGHWPDTLVNWETNQHCLSLYSWWKLLFFYLLSEPVCRHESGRCHSFLTNSSIVCCLTFPVFLLH